MGDAVGARLPEDLLNKIEELSRVQGEDRSTTMRNRIQRGFEAIARERAAQGYKEDRMTLSEADKRAGSTVWAMEQPLVHHGYHSSYLIQDLANEFKTLNPQAPPPEDSLERGLDSARLNPHTNGTSGKIRFACTAYARTTRPA